MDAEVAWKLLSLYLLVAVLSSYLVVLHKFEVVTTTQIVHILLFLILTGNNAIFGLVLLGRAMYVTLNVAWCTLTTTL